MEESDRSLIIYQNNNITILYIIGALSMSILSLISLFIDFSDVESDHFLAVFTGNIVGLIILKTILFIGFVFLDMEQSILLKERSQEKELLIVDEKGITDNTSAISLGLIDWADIKRVYIDEVLENRFIELEIENEEKYLNNLPWIKRKQYKQIKKWDIK